MKNSRHFLRALSLILAMATVFLTSSFTVVAEDSTVINQNEIITDVTEEVSFGNPDEFIPAVYEVEDLREENVKHFSLPDGTYQAVSYGGAVHRPNADGTWRDIDNRLFDSKSEYTTEDGRISFARSTLSLNGEALLYTLTEDNYMIAMGIVGTSSFGDITADDNAVLISSADVTNHAPKPEILVTDSAEEQLSKLRNIDNTTEIVYEDILSGTDIEYVLTGNDIKENIIVKSKRDSYTYTFVMIVKGLTAAENGDGSITLSDEMSGEAVYYIPAPYMYDANGEISYAVSYTLAEDEQNVYTLTVTADETWINADDRAFPVVIDPYLRVTNSNKDTYISSQAPYANNGASEQLKVSGNETALIYAQFPTLPDGAIYNDANISLCYYFAQSSGSMDVGAYMILGSWTESTDYITCPDISDFSCAVTTLSASTSITETTPRRIGFDIGEIAEMFYDNDPTNDANYGFAFQKENSGTLNSVTFYSYNKTGKTPMLTVQYSDIVPDGVYAFRANDYPTIYLSVEDSIATAGADLQQKILQQSPVASSSVDRSCLFKIKRDESTGTYIIRSMLNNRLTIDVSDGEITTKVISGYDSEVVNEDKFRIWWGNGGFVLSDYYGDAIVHDYPDSTVDILTIPDIEESAASVWGVSKYYGSGMRDIDIYYPEEWKSTGIVVGETYIAQFCGWSTDIDENLISVSSYAGYEDIGTVDGWNSNTNTLTFTANSLGEIKFTARMFMEGFGSPIYTEYPTYRVVPAEGTYYLQNAETERYMDVEGPSTASGANIQQWDFHTGNSERWELEHVENSGGYVRFKSKLSNLYLGVNSDIPSLIQQYSALDDSTLWKLDTADSGNVKLICKATESSGNVLAVPSSANANGTDLTLDAYTDDTDYWDEWFLITKVLSLVNYYDSTFANDSAKLQSITMANSFVNTVFARYFNIGIHMDGAPTQYATIADDCDVSNNGPCTFICGSNCGTDHHKNIERISDQIYNSPREYEHIYVLWTNRPSGSYCLPYGDNAHILIENAIAVVIDYRPVIHFMNIAGSTSTEQAMCMAISLVHEVCHTLNMEEQYNKLGHDREEDYICIMEGFEADFSTTFYNKIISGEVKPFCDSCMDDMHDKTSYIYIPGN